MEISMFMVSVIVFVMACFVGYHVIWGVTPALHTPLMAVTNAISGIVVVAAILVAGAYYGGGTDCVGEACNAGWQSVAAPLIGFFAVMLASINIFGGFAISRRMLAMFRKKDK